MPYTCGACQSHGALLAHDPPHLPPPKLRLFQSLLPPFCSDTLLFQPSKALPTPPHTLRFSAPKRQSWPCPVCCALSALERWIQQLWTPPDASDYSLYLLRDSHRAVSYFPPIDSHFRGVTAPLLAQGKKLGCEMRKEHEAYPAGSLSWSVCGIACCQSSHPGRSHLQRTCTHSRLFSDTFFYEKDDLHQVSWQGLCKFYT